MAVPQMPIKWMVFGGGHARFLRFLSRLRGGLVEVVGCDGGLEQVEDWLFGVGIRQERHGHRGGG